MAASGPKHQPIEESRRLAPMRDLLRELYGGVPPVLDIDKMSLAGLRDELLKVFIQVDFDVCFDEAWTLIVCVCELCPFYLSTSF
jgi:hypothetical protein